MVTMRVWARALSAAAWLPRAMSAWAWLAVLAAAEAVAVAAADADAEAHSAWPVCRACLLPRLTASPRLISRPISTTNISAAAAA